MEKYRVTLTDRERAELEQLVSTGKAAARKLLHARILLLADTEGADEPDIGIVDSLGCSLSTLLRVRRQFVTCGIETAMCRRAQPRRPDRVKIKGDLEQRLVSLACSDPPEGRCHWTLRLLGDELVALGLVETISRETIRQALKKTTFGLGWSPLGAFPPMPTRSSSGGWKMYSKSTSCPTILHSRWSVSTRQANNCSAKFVPQLVASQAKRIAAITNTSGREFATSC